MDVLKIVGWNIRNCRHAHDWSIEKLAEEADLSPAYLGEVERGRENISLNSLAKLAKALKVELSELVKSSIDSSR